MASSKRMDAGGIDGVDGVDAGHHGGDHRAGQLVDDRAEAGVLLRRPADDGERPDRVRAVIDGLDVQDGKVVRQAVVAEVIAERPFGQLPVGIDRADDAEVGLGGDGQAGLARRATMRTRRPPRAAGEGQLRQPFRQRHDGGEGHRRRPADEDVDPERHALAQRRRVMHADAAMDLVVQPDLAIGPDTGCPTAARGTCRGWSAASRAGRRPRCRPAAR